MEQSTDNRTGFLGTYFDRDATLKVARWADVLAWVVLAMYAYNTLVAIGQQISMLASGAISYEGVSFFDRLSIPTMLTYQIAPGLVYFILLKVAQQALLILLDMEDNSRRAARK